MNKIFLLITPLLFFIGCDKIPSGIVDSKSNNFQVIGITAPNVFVYSQSDSSFTTSIKINTNKNISSIWLNYFSSNGKKLNSNQILLEDNGDLVNGDTIKGDNIFSVKLSLSKYYPIGQYLIEYFITDFNNNTTKVGIHNFNYYNGQQNYPPVISQLTAPDSIHLIGKEQIISISLVVQDFNGLNDIKQVYFNSFIPPNGAPSSSNPISLFDDGTHGDISSGDGLYTTQVRLPSSGVLTGTYRWEFQAIDRSDSLSNKIIHNVVIL